MLKKISVIAILLFMMNNQSIEAMNCSCISEEMYKKITQEVANQTIAVVKNNTNQSINQTICCLAVTGCIINCCGINEIKNKLDEIHRDIKKTR